MIYQTYLIFEQYTNTKTNTNPLVFKTDALSCLFLDILRDEKLHGAT